MFNEFFVRGITSVQDIIDDVKDQIQQIDAQLREYDHLVVRKQDLKRFLRQIDIEPQVVGGTERLDGIDETMLVNELKAAFEASESILKRDLITRFSNKEYVFSALKKLNITRAISLNGPDIVKGETWNDQYSNGD